MGVQFEAISGRRIPPLTRHSIIEKLCKKQATVNGKLQKFNEAPEMSHLAAAFSL
jgi:hypothetical protein